MKRIYLFFLIFLFVNYSEGQTSSIVFKDSVQINQPIYFINWQQNTPKIGVFCQWENALERRTSVPIRLRLGSLSYCNYLEYGK